MTARKMKYLARLSVEEKDRLERVARAAGMTVSDWIRETALKYERRLAKGAGVKELERDAP